MSARGTATWTDLFPGKADDSLWYDPWNQTRITAEEARDERAKERVVPEGHRTGFRYSTNPDPSGLYCDNAKERESTPAQEMDIEADVQPGNDDIRPAATGSGRGESDDPHTGGDNDVAMSFAGSGMSWLQNPANSSGSASESGFLASFLRDSGIEIGADVSDIASMREAVRRRVGSHTPSGGSQSGPEAQGYNPK